MKKNKILLLTLLLGWLLALPCWTFAQEVQVKRAEKTVVIGGKKFYMHHVNAGETLYAISKAYCVSEDDIMTYNPDLKRTGLKAKTVIGIPYVEKTEDSSQKTEVVAAKPETVAPKPETVTPKPVKDTIVTIGGKRYVMHYVLAGETLWGVSHAFNVSEEEILDKNPEIKDGLKAGMVVGIPYVEKPEAVTPQPTVKPVEPEPVVATVEPEKPAVPEEPEKPAAPEEPEPEVVPADSEGPKLVVVKPEPTVLSPVSDDDEYHDGYVIHTVKKSEKTRSMLHGWNVSEEEFRQLNPSVGSRVFVGQKVLIPIVSHKDGPSTPTEPEILNEPAAPVEPEVSGEPEVPVEPEASTADESVAEHPVEEPEVMDENPEMRLIYPEEKPFSCYSSRTYADQTYKVALLVPLYLDEVDKVNTARSRNGRTKKARSLRFLQFYEGFMMAVDSLTEYHGLNLDLTVIDVTEDTTKAVAAVEKLRGQDVDLIIGPFFSKSFAVVEDYAALRDILVVNPLSERESVVVDADNVVKLKPSPQSMVTELTRLIRTKYPKSKVTLITPSNVKDTVMVQAIENALAVAVQPEVQLSNAEMVELITRESQRRKMGKRVLSNLEVEGQVFSTKALEAHPDDVTYFQNHFRHISYSDNELKTFREDLSSARDNVLVAYGDDLVFATKVLNSVNKSAKKFPITLIGLPDWSEFENLLVQNLLNMNAIYFDDHFVNYNDSTVLQFVDNFREKYDSEPEMFAFEGFDVGWYFLNALMDLGPEPKECLPYYHKDMLHSNFYFNKFRMSDGLENRYWNIYQYDNHDIELKPVRIHPQEE